MRGKVQGAAGDVIDDRITPAYAGKSEIALIELVEL